MITMMMKRQIVGRIGLACGLGLVVGSGWLSAASGPGEHFFEVQKALIQKFDQNDDGRLGPAEREAMRRATAERSAKKAAGKGLPAEFLAKHDSNKNGEMDGEEWGPAIEKEVEVIVKRFDADKSGQLEKPEKAAVRAALRKGEFEGVYGYFAGRAAEDPDEAKKQRRRGPSYLEQSRALLSFDVDGDGIASESELETIRASRQKQ